MAEIIVPDDQATIQQAITAAIAAGNVTKIRIKDGTYSGANNRDIDCGTLVNCSIEAYTPNSTAVIIDGLAGNYYGFYVHSSGISFKDLKVYGFRPTNGYGGGFNIADNHCTLTNIHIQQCYTSGVGGGGIKISASSGSFTLTMNNCIVHECVALYGGGGGIYVGNNATITINTAQIYSNQSQGGVGCRGGGIDIVNTNIGFLNYLNNVLIYNNTVHSSGGDGGGLNVRYATCYLNHCVIDSNSAPAGMGGGIHTEYDGYVNAFDTLIVSNSASSYGGGFVSLYKDPVFRNCTIAYNTSGLQGGGIALSVNATLTDCIVRFNTATGTGDDIQFSSTIAANYCDIRVYGAPYIEGGGTLNRSNCIDADPVFADKGDFLPTGSSDSYYLNQATSPCKDTGSQTAVAAGLDQRTTATSGAKDTGVVDMGYHYEYITTGPTNNQKSGAFMQVN